MKIKRITAAGVVILLLIALCMGLSSCATETKKINTFDDLNGARVGVTVGSTFDGIVEELYPGAQLVYIETFFDNIPALESRKIDCFLADEPWARYFEREIKTLTHLNEILLEDDYSLVFAKNEDGIALRDEFNEFLHNVAEDELVRLRELWFSPDESDHPTLDYESLKPTGGKTIKVGVDSTNPPFEMFENGKIVGYDIDLLYRFCKSRGYAMETMNMAFDAMIPAVSSGVIDIASSTYSVTEERQKSVAFSDTVYPGGIVVCIPSDYVAEPVSFESILSGIGESFSKTFAKEQRWKLFVEGIDLTMKIAVISLLVGTLLGFLLYLLSRRGWKWPNAMIRFFDWLISGMPEVLLLMILFYLIFSKSSISGFWVAVIGFSLIVMMNVYSMVRSGVATVDPGQNETLLALGYSPTFGFFRVIFPQALEAVMPRYRSFIISLLKSTAIVGYLGVEDLTQISDIVRSRTYESFFPLIVTAVIYFGLSALLIFVVDFLQKRILPTRRNMKRYLKNVSKDTKGETK